MPLQKISRQCIVIGVVTSLLFGSNYQTHAQPNVPTFEDTDCQVEVPQELDVRCGDLLVPEDRADPNSPIIRLHVAIVASASSNPQPDPIV